MDPSQNPDNAQPQAPNEPPEDQVADSASQAQPTAGSVVPPEAGVAIESSEPAPGVEAPAIDPAPPAEPAPPEAAAEQSVSPSSSQPVEPAPVQADQMPTEQVSPAPEAAAPNDSAAPIQDTNPQDAPAQPDVAEQPVAASNETSPSGPAATAGQAVVSTDPAPVATNKKKLPKWLLPVAIAIVVVIAAVVSYFIFFANSSLTLETHKGSDYSLLVPSEYEYTSHGSEGDVFSLDSSTEAKGGVLVRKQSYDQGISLSADQQAEVATEIDKSVDQMVDSLRGSLGDKTTNVKVDETKVDSHEARRISAIIEKDGEESGRLAILIAYNSKGAHVVAVASSDKTPGLADSASKILGSFKFN